MKDPAFKAEHDRNQRVAWLNARLSVLEWDFNFVKDQFRLKKMEQEYFEAKAELRTLGQTFPEDELVVNADTQANTAYEFINSNQKQLIKNATVSKNYFIDNVTVQKEILVPKDANITRNISEAQLHYGNILWFYNQVKNQGLWDYKQQGKQYEKFGNFNYGVTGAALGLEEQFLLRAAGYAQSSAKTSLPTWGDPGFILSGGTPPYGDDPVDQYWIKQGILYYQKSLNSSE